MAVMAPANVMLDSLALVVSTKNAPSIALVVEPVMVRLGFANVRMVMMGWLAKRSCVLCLMVPSVGLVVHVQIQECVSATKALMGKIAL